MEVRDEREENVPRTDKQRDAILKGKEQKEERKLEGREREEGKRERERSKEYYNKTDSIIITFLFVLLMSSNLHDNQHF